MLEPQAENPKLLLEHHRRRAALNFEAGDQEASYWHGRQAQKAMAKIMDVQRVIEDGLLDRLWDDAFSKGDSYAMAAIQSVREATQAERVAASQLALDVDVIISAKPHGVEPETSQPGGPA